MLSRHHWQCIFGLIIGLSASSANALPQPQQVSPHVWAWIGPYEAPTKANQGFRMNLGFVVGTQAVAVIDSGYTPGMAREMLSQIRAITPLPVRYVINTNSQPHRFMGNDVFRQAGARIIASSDAAERMRNEGHAFASGIAAALEWPEPPGVPEIPELLIDEGTGEIVDLGGSITLRIEHYGRTHTRGTLVVQVAPDQTVFAGDILYGGRLLAILPDSHVGMWITAFERLRGVEAKVFIPGHGNPGVLADFEHPTYAYLSGLKAHMDLAIENGTDMAEATASFDAQPWSTLANFSELAGRNASLAYLEREAENF